MSEQLCKDFRKLCIKNVNESDISTVLNICEEYATVINHNVHNNRNGNKNQCMLFPNFTTKTDASVTKDALTARGYMVDFANTKRTEPQSPPPGTSSANTSGSANITANFDKNEPYGICVRCGQNAYYNCARCDDFYCSVDCQKIDWPVHKLNCFPMPELLPSRFHQNLMNTKPTKKPATEAATETAPVHSSTDRTVEATASIPNGTKMAHGSNHEKTMAPQQKEHALSNGDNNAAATATPQSSASTTPATSSLPPSQRIPNDSEVFITYVKTHQKVYIRSLATDDAYRTLMHDVAEAASTAPKLCSFPIPKKDNVLAPYDDIYYRGFVLECNTAARTVRVAFIDFGNIEDVPFDGLKQLPEELCQRPRLVLLAQLKNVRDNIKEGEAEMMQIHLENISEFSEEPAHVLKVRGEGANIEHNQTVELFDLHTNQSISDKLNCLFN